jgi:hypothetical protein
MENCRGLLKLHQDGASIAPVPRLRNAALAGLPPPIMAENAVEAITLWRQKWQRTVTRLRAAIRNDQGDHPSLVRAEELGRQFLEDTVHVRLSLLYLCHSPS